MTHDPTSPPAGREPAATDGAPDDVGPENTDTDTDLDDLMMRLSSIADQVDAPPPLVADLARAAFETRDLDAELAVLTADSDVDALALTRAAETTTAPRMVSFEASSSTVELQFDILDGGVSIRGLVTDRHSGAIVELDTGHGRQILPLDADGWFGAAGVVAGRVRLRIIDPSGSVVATPWISI